MKKKIILKVILFLLIGLLLFQAITTILLPEWIGPEGVSQLLRGFYEEPKNSIDVMYLGNSNIYRSIAPLVIFNDTGIVSYAYSTPGQKLCLSYYLMKECFEYQKPKVILLDMDEAFDEEKQKPTAENTRKVLDNMRMGKNKIEALNDPIFELSAYDKLTYIFPIMRYHSRWNQITGYDFRRLVADYKCPFKGYLITREKKARNDKKRYMERNNNIDYVGEKAKQYIEKMIELCKQNGTELVLIEVPSAANWSYDKSKGLEQLANEYGLKFLDMNLHDEIGIDWDNDTEDGGTHLNVYGAEKVSKFLGEYLKNNFELTDPRQEDLYASWYKHYELYLKERDKKV